MYGVRITILITYICFSDILRRTIKYVIAKYDGASYIHVNSLGELF
jgi:hypothetical protein